jgi:hypothetical protein
MYSRADVLEENSDSASALLQAEPRGFSAAVKLLQEVNARLLDLLAFESQLTNEARLPIAVELGDMFRQMDPGARARVAASPFLLIDAGFQDLQRWSRVGCEIELANDSAGCFLRPQAIELAHMTFVLAWSLARSNHEAACVMLGLSPGCAEIVANLRLQDLQRIAILHNAWIRPRWEGRPDIWRHLLRTANSPKSPAEAAASLHGLQLFFGNVLVSEPSEHVQHL